MGEQAVFVSLGARCASSFLGGTKKSLILDFGSHCQ